MTKTLLDQKYSDREVGLGMYQYDKNIVDAYIRHHNGKKPKTVAEAYSEYEM